MEHSTGELSLDLARICIVKDCSEKTMNIKFKISLSPPSTPRTQRVILYVLSAERKDGQRTSRTWRGESYGPKNEIGKIV
jgi:hypothetical protein